MKRYACFSYLIMFLLRYRTYPRVCYRTLVLFLLYLYLALSLVPVLLKETQAHETPY